MSLPPLATVAELEERLGVPVGSLAGQDLTRAQRDLEDASDLVREEAGLDWVAEDGATVTAPNSVKVVVLRAAKRSYQNPENLSSENMGSGAYGWSRPRTEIGIYLTDAERRIVRQAAGKAGGTNGLYSVRTPSAYSLGV